MPGPQDRRQRNPDTDRYYDRYERNPQATAFYRSKGWLAIRRAVLIRDHGLCQPCLRSGQVKPADAVHHIKELLQHWDLRLDMDNLESICDECHNRERAGESTAAGLGFDPAGNVIPIPPYLEIARRRLLTDGRASNTPEWIYT